VRLSEARPRPTSVPFRYDVSPDGRFLITVRASKEPLPPLVLVLDWQAGLKK
jgi:hypothetical protein